MAVTRPYRIEFNGQVRMVEAGHISQAIAHLAKLLVVEARPARASEVAAFCRDGGRVEIAGEAPEPETKAQWPVESIKPPLPAGIPEDAREELAAALAATPTRTGDAEDQ